MKAIMKFSSSITIVLVTLTSCKSEIHANNYEKSIQGLWRPIDLVTEKSFVLDTTVTFEFKKGRYSYKSEGFNLDSNYLIELDTITFFGRFPGIRNPKNLIRLTQDTLRLMEFDDKSSASSLLLIRAK